MLLFHHYKMSAAPIPASFLMAAETAVGSATFGQVVASGHNVTCLRARHVTVWPGEENRRASGLVQSPGSWHAATPVLSRPPSITSLLQEQASPCRNLPLTCALLLPASETFCFLSIEDGSVITHYHSPAERKKEGQIREESHTSLGIVKMLHSRIRQWVPADLWKENVIGIDKDSNCLETLTTSLSLKTQQENLIHLLGCKGA